MRTLQSTARFGDDMSFEGFKKETFEFLMELTFNNNIEWFNLNRKRYETFVRDPLRALTAELMPAALDIDPNFNPSVNSSVSRIRRDTRYSYDKSPFRNHMWIAFRYPGTSVSEGCALYFEITPTDYSYGFGFYAASTEFMQAYRKRLLADPHGFLAMAHELEANGYGYSADPYKRDHYKDADADLKPYINVKSFAWTKHFNDIGSLIEPSDIKDRLVHDYDLARPMYALMRSVIESI